MVAVRVAARTTAIGAPAISAALVIGRACGVTVAGVSAGAAVAALATVVMAGAVAHAAKPIALTRSARLIDRAIAAPAGAASNDAVLAAVALVEPSGAATTPFVDALTVQALARARTVSIRRAVPAPAAVRYVPAVAGIAALAIAILIPPHVWSSVAGRARDRAASQPRAAAATSATAEAARVRFALAELDAEMEAAGRAGAEARDADDPRWSHLADTFHDLVDELAHAGVEAAAANARAQALAEAARDAAATASRARAAAGAATASLATARAGVASDASALAAAIAGGGADQAAIAAARLARGGGGGPSALGRAADTAAAALGVGAAASATGDAQSDRARDEQTRHLDGDRRTGAGASTSSPSSVDSSPSSSASESASSQSSSSSADAQRQLEHLRRDLAEAGTACRNDPSTCSARADGAGRALGTLGERGATADARERLAQAIEQLRDRIRRAGASPGNSVDLRRFARAAAGPGRAPPPTGASPAGAGVGATDRQHVGDQGASQGDRGEDPSAAAPGDNDADSIATSAGAPASSGATASSVAGGIGSQPGGRVLGARSTAGSHAGHDAQTTLAVDESGPSRAQTIGGAAAAGFATAPYREVFAEYHAALEESLDRSDVPPGRRTLVRRYFQLIRPRTPASRTPPPRTPPP